LNYLNNIIFHFYSSLKFSNKNSFKYQMSKVNCISETNSTYYDNYHLSGSSSLKSLGGKSLIISEGVQIQIDEKEYGVQN